MKQNTINDKKTILVTGGAGFIGSHIVDELIKQNLRVVVIDDLSGGFEENINKEAIFINKSITDDLESIFKRYKFDYVFHLAAYAAEGLSHFIRKFNYQNNLIGSINLINNSIKYDVKCFVFTSSIAVYGTNQTPMKEDLVPHPEDPYGISKYAVELDLEAAYRQFGLNYIIFRPHNVYGERQNIGDKYRNVIGIFINNMMHNRESIIFGDGSQTRAFTYVKDIAPIIANSIFNREVYNQIFNIGTDNAYSINELTEIMGVTNLKYEPERNEVKHAFADHTKLRKYFDIEETPLEDGIASMWLWALRRGKQKTKKFTEIEITKNLPQSWKS